MTKLVRGTVTRRWQKLVAGERCNVEIAILANHVDVNNEVRAHQATEDLTEEFRQFWLKHRDEPLVGRDFILKSICPNIHGLYLVKLALALILIGGVRKRDKTGIKVRGDGHLLLVGDPGTGKSQFLRFAARITPRSVLTTGIGSTNAGLTCAAIKDSGEWQLEAGALVLADKGICCIDEFGSIRESDKTAIHEAMEQQSISVAKAGLVCKLNTRCSIIAATNPKGKYDPTQNVSVNIALGSPLLSRFDLVLILLDSQDPAWDRLVASSILENELPKLNLDLEKSQASQDIPDIWNVDKIQGYFAYAKTRFHPRMSEESMTVLKRYYQLQRAADTRNAARTTVRLLESLIRLAEGHSRLMCRNQVTIQDAIFPIVLMESSMLSSSLLDLGPVLHVKFPEDPVGSYEEIESTLLHKLGLDHYRHFSDGNQENLAPPILDNEPIEKPRSQTRESLEPLEGIMEHGLDDELDLFPNMQSQRPPLGCTPSDRPRKFIY